MADPNDERVPASIQVSLAEIKNTLVFVQRDIADIKTSGSQNSKDIGLKVQDLQSWRDRMDGSLKTLARAQAILYGVFIIGMGLGLFDAFNVIHK